MEQQNKVVYVFEEREYNTEDWPPRNPEGFMAWWAGKIAEIPAEHREKATVRLTATESYGDAFAEIEIFYVRPETPEEASARETLSELERMREIERLHNQLARLGAR